MQSILGLSGRVLHKHFLLLLLGAYAGATFWPEVGQAARHFSLGNFVVARQAVSLTLPMMLLAGLLFNAGLGSAASEMTRVVRKPKVLLIGLAVNLAVPLLFIFLALPFFRLWHDRDDIQNLLLGLAIVAAMPIAGSSIAWSQKASGNVELSMGLVVFSTLLCPLTTPLTLVIFGALAKGKYAQALVQMSGQGIGAFMLISVVVPSFAGLLVKHLCGSSRIARIKSGLIVINGVALLFLCYVNASAVLPQMLAAPNWSFLAMIFVIVSAMCLAGFMAGWLVARFLDVDRSRQRSLVFGLGMNNNGTGMVLANTALATLPSALLPVLAYNLVQHLVAGGVDRLVVTRRAKRRRFPDIRILIDSDLIAMPPLEASA
jgi:BASS family bile acid:Na+ symporter